MAPRDLWEKKLLSEKESKLWFLSPGMLLQFLSLFDYGIVANCTTMHCGGAAALLYNSHKSIIPYMYKCTYILRTSLFKAAKFVNTATFSWAMHDLRICI